MRQVGDRKQWELDWEWVLLRKKDHKHSNKKDVIPVTQKYFGSVQCECVRNSEAADRAAYVGMSRKNKKVSKRI